MVRVLVLSQSEVVRRGLGSMLGMQPDVVDITAHENAASTSALTGAESVDILIVSPELGDEKLQGIRASLASSGSKILMLLRESDGNAVMRASELHADGFILESELTTATLGNTLTRVLQGDVPMPAFLARELLTRLQTEESRPAPESKPGRRPFLLTQREKQVLALVVEGLSNKQIARRLQMSENGAKRHVASVLAKLNAPNRTVAAALAIREGLLEAT